MAADCPFRHYSRGGLEANPFSPFTIQQALPCLLHSKVTNGTAVGEGFRSSPQFTSVQSVLISDFLPKKDPAFKMVFSDIWLLC